MRYAIVIENAGGNFSAYVPDLPGCVSTGKTVRQVKANIQQDISIHLEGVNLDGHSIPPPTSLAENTDVATNCAQWVASKYKLQLGLVCFSNRTHPGVRAS